MHLILDARKRILQPLLNERNRKVGDIDSNPFALEFLGSVDARPATTERVEDDVALIRTCTDDSFKEGLRLLGRVSESLLGLRIYRENIRPHILKGNALGVV